MTVSNELSRKTYAGDDATTSFSTSPVVFFDTNDLTVYVVINSTDAATLLVEGVDYTVSGGDGSTGTVNLAGGSDPHGALFSGTTLVIVRELDITQETDFVNNDSSDAEVLEDALDRSTMILQQLNTRVARTVSLADSDVTGADVTLPTPQANKLIGWNGDGDELVNYAAGDLDDLGIVTAFAATMLDDADAAAVLTTLGLSATIQSRLLALNTAAVEPTTTFWSTGDVKVTFKTTADSGWVLMNDGTIGNASSSATTRANADTEALFTLLWTNTDNADCAVSTGRGASAAADFAANKTIALPKVLGRDLAISGAGSALTSRALASVLGAETKTIGTTNLPASGLSIPSLSVTATGTADSASNVAGSVQNSGGGEPVGTLGSASVSVTGSTGTGTTGNMGSGNALDIMNPRFHANVMIKL